MILKNFSSGILATSIGTSDTSITVNAGNTLPSTSGTFTAIIWNSTVYASPALDFNAEIVLGAYSSANVYTITRAQESTVATAHSAGAAVGLYITAGVLNSLQGPILSVSNTSTQSGIGTGTQRTFTTVNKDSGGYWASNTYTPLLAGWYFVSYTDAVIDTSADIQCLVAIYKNGSEFNQSAFAVPSGFTSNKLGGTVTAIVQCNGSTDYIQFFVGTTGSATTAQGTGCSYASIIKVF